MVAFFKRAILACALLFNGAAGAAAAKPGASVFGAYALTPFMQRVSSQVFSSSEAVVFQGGGNAAAEAALVMGQQDFAAMTRPISASMLELARSRNIKITDHVLGYDAFFFFAHPSSHLTTLTVPAIRSLFDCTVTQWDQIPEAGLKGPITVAATRSQQATLASILGLERLGACVQMAEEKGPLMDIVSKNALAIGCSPDNASDSSRRLTVSSSAKAPAVTPIFDNVRNGRYPLFAPLYIYTAEGGYQPGPDSPLSHFAEYLIDRSLTDEIAMDLDIVTPYWP